MTTTEGVKFIVENAVEGTVSRVEEVGYWFWVGR